MWRWRWRSGRRRDWASRRCEVAPAARDLSTLPLALRGKSSMVSSCSGIFCFARPASRQYVTISLKASVAPSRSTTTAQQRSPRAVGKTDDRDVGDRGVGVENVLDLFGRDVLAFANDDVLEPAGDGEETVVVELAEVAGAKPALVVECVRVRRNRDSRGRSVVPWPSHLAAPGRHRWPSTSTTRSTAPPMGRPTVCDRCSSVSRTEFTVRKGISVRP